MHLQIRKKEKYLLISMVCYLLIVSSALFLIFSPVTAYTEVWSASNLGTMAHGWEKVDSIEFFHGQNASGYVTKVSVTGYVYSASALSGTSSGKLCGDTGCSIKRGNYSLSWSTATAGSYTSVGTIDCIILDSSFPSTGYELVYFENTVGLPKMYFDYDWGHVYSTGGDGHIYGATFAAYGPPYGGVPQGSSYTHSTYTGSGLPDVPVINSVASYPPCLEPGTGVVLESNVTGTVDDWTWEIYDQSDTSVFTGSSPIEQMVDLYVLSPGDYNVQLTVENEGGNDFWQQDDFLHINQSGTCNFTQYNPFPTVNVTPTQNVFVTVTMPPSVIVNITGVNDIINNSYLGNMSLGYRQYVDGIGEGFNTTITGVVIVVQSPLTMVVNGIAEGVSLFTISVNSLMSYTTIPLAIVGITLSYYPWQIITLITAGIAIDAAFVLIFGVR